MSKPIRRQVTLPKIVAPSAWRRASRKLLVKEKAATRARDRLAAERRRLPMVPIEKDYVFTGPQGRVRLIDLFAGRPQLILYHFMFAPGVGGWPAAGCPGCSMMVDQFGHPAHLHARGGVPLPGVAGAPAEASGLQEADALDDPLVLVRRQHLQPGFRPLDQPRRDLRLERLRARRRKDLSHLLYRRARRGGAGQRLDASGSGTLWPTGKMGGRAGGPPPGSTVCLVAAPRQLRPGMSAPRWPTIITAVAPGMDAHAP